MIEDKDIKIKKFWQDLYIELMSNPFDHRTDKQFCEEHQLALPTLASWKKKYRLDIFNEVTKRRKEYITELRAQNIKEIVKNIGESFNDRQLLAKITGDLVERVEQKTELLGRDDIMRRMRVLLQSIGDKKKTWEEASPVAEGAKTNDPNGPGNQEPGKDMSDAGKV